MKTGDVVIITKRGRFNSRRGTIVEIVPDHEEYGIGDVLIIQTRTMKVPCFEDEVELERKEVLVARINDHENGNVIEVIKSRLNGKYYVNLIMSHGTVTMMSFLKAKLHDVINEALWQSKEHQVIFDD